MHKSTDFRLPGADYSQTCAALLAAKFELVDTVQEAIDAKLAEERERLKELERGVEMIHYTGIEDLLFATLDAVSRFRVSQREAVGAALEAGGLLTEAKGRLKHGEWGDWIGRVGLASRTGSMWMKLAGMDVTAEDVIERGGIVQTLRGGTPKSARLPICLIGTWTVSWPMLKPRSQTPSGHITTLLAAATPL